MLSTENLKPPLPIDWEVPTRGCKLAINGTSSELGYLNIANARIRNFLQPAIFPKEIEIWPPGSRSEIGWLQFQGDPQKEPSKKHPFEHNTNDWDSPTNIYNIDLVIGKDNEIVRNVMTPTNSKVFWGSMGPFGKFDGVHEISAWRFASNEACKYYFLGALAFIWDVPTDLDPLSTYRLKFTINSNAEEEHISGPFRIQASRRRSARTIQPGWEIFAFALFGVFIVGLLAGRIVWAKLQSNGLIRLEEADGSFER